MAPNPLQQVAQNVGGGISETINQVTGTPEGGGEQKFRKYLKKHHFTESGTETFDVGPDDFTKIGEFVVPAQEQYRWGYGSAEYDTNQGYIYVDLQNSTPAAIQGSLRIQQRDAQSRNIITVEELDLEPLRASKSDRTQMVPLPEQTSQPKVGRDSRLTLAASSEASDTVDWANSEVIAPVAVYPV